MSEHPDDRYDAHFYWDPVCPFAWMTSKWLRQVQRLSAYSVDWRFISLRLVNAEVDYDAHFPPEYLQGHTNGLRLLRVAAAVRATEGRAAIGPLYEAMGTSLFEVPRSDDADERAARRRRVGTADHARGVLTDAGLPVDCADAVDDTSFDAEIGAETAEALALTGKDVGTPIIHYFPPDGAALFGPVISRLPSDEDAVRLWDHVVGLASFPSFTELKRSLRELPQLPAFGVSESEPGTVEDWHAGSRRQKK